MTDMYLTLGPMKNYLLFLKNGSKATGGRPKKYFGLSFKTGGGRPQNFNKVTQ